MAAYGLSPSTHIWLHVLRSLIHSIHKQIIYKTVYMPVIHSYLSLLI